MIHPRLPEDGEGVAVDGNPAAGPHAGERVVVGGVHLRFALAADSVDAVDDRRLQRLEIELQPELADRGTWTMDPATGVQLGRPFTDPNAEARAVGPAIPKAGRPIRSSKRNRRRSSG